MYLRYLLSSLFSIIFLAPGHAQSGYDIQFKIHGLKDTTAYLGYYLSENTLICDTAKVNNKGEFKFDGKKNLGAGMYFLVLDHTKVVEFVVSKSQYFSLETSTDDYVKHMHVKNDIDNKLFFENMMFVSDRNKESDPYVKIVKDSTLSNEKKKDALDALTKINEKVLAHQQEIIDKYPATLTARLFKASKPVQIPAPPKKADGTIDSTFQLRWYRQHFFDNFDLSDDALLRLSKPMYSEKLNEYVDKLFVPQPDTINRVIDNLVLKGKKNQETYKYLVYTFMIKYQTPKIMGMDEVFVHLYDKYFATGEMDYWANAKMKSNIKDFAERIRLSMLGKQAPDLIMKDTHDKLQSLYNVKTKYTMVFFFDPDCGHCRKETPKLVEFYNKDKAKYNLEVFAVSTDSSMTKLKDFIKEFNINWITVNHFYSAVGHYQQLYDATTMPTLYVLDEKKKIIGKKISVEQLEEFLSNYEKFNKKKPDIN